MLPEIEEMFNEWKAYLKEYKGYLEEDFVYNLNKKLIVNEEEHTMIAELAIKLQGVNFMILKFERPARPLIPLERRTAAIARIIDKNPYPFAILTNESDSVFIDVIKGKTSYEFEIPSRDESMNILKELNIEKLSDEEEDKEKRIFATIDSIKCEVCKD